MIRKLKKGKGSPDGITAEMFEALPEPALEKLTSFFNKALLGLIFPQSWTTSQAVLIPKVIGAASLSKLRAIACLSTAKKIPGNIWMRMLPVLEFRSFQTGFVKGCQAADGVYVVYRAAEVSREWGLKLYAVQIDLKKAFDRVLHSAALRAVAL